MRLDETPRLGRVIRIRIPGTPRDATYDELFRRPPFTVLAEGEHWSVSGLAGRIWSFDRSALRPVSGGDELRSWDVPGTVRVGFAHWVEPDPQGTAFVSEARVVPVDRLGALRLRALWAVVGPFERLIGAEPLRLATAVSGRGGARKGA